MSDNPYPPPNVPPTQVPPPAPPPGPLKTGMAVTALVLGVVGLVSCPILGIVAIVLGIVALSRSSAEPQRYGGRGMAIGGIVCGGASFFTGMLLLSILLPSLSRARELSKRLVCAANLKGIGTTVILYANEEPSSFGPPSLNLLVNQGDITREQLICPANEAGTANYVYIPQTVKFDDPQADHTVLAYEPKSNHEDEGGNILFADGHVTFVKVPEYDHLVAGAGSGNP